MITPRANIHYSRLPPPGAVGHIVGLSTGDAHRKCIVSRYPLFDSPDYRYSIGIHTVYVRFLDNAEFVLFSDFWIKELP